MIFRRRRRVRIHFLPNVGGEMADLEGILAGRVDGRYLLLTPKLLQDAETSYSLDNAVEVPVGTVWFMERLASA